MSDTSPIPVNLSAIEARQAKREAKESTARQVASAETLKESMEEGFNPGAVEREQARLNRSRPLTHRRSAESKQEKKIQAVDKKADEELAQNYSRRNRELPPDRLIDLRRSLKENARPDEILKEVTRAFKDPSLADEAFEFLERSTEGDLQRNVRLARSILQQEKGREIAAGRNVDPAAKYFHQKGLGESPTELRDLYRDITGNPRDHNTLFNELSSSYSFDQLKMVAAFLLQSLGYDLKSKGPSIQQAELLRMMTDIRNLQSMLWVYFYFRSRMRLIRSLYGRYGIDFSKSLTFELLAKEFMKLVEERYPSILKLLQQAEKMGLIDTAKIIILNQFLAAIRQLSPRLYRSLKHKQDLLLVLMETLDELEEKEEEQEEKEKEKEKEKKQKKKKK